ncbi:MAG TPA: Rho termination factor N-terminal domain-containing protein [Micromonosporaceae bacterium]|nr:Rho termination factor N-terminal domain-containing protein [Micromonosporaceae bacterium]
MNDVTKLTLTILQRISEFLQTLPEGQLNDIAEGRATLTYHPYGAVQPVAPARRPVGQKPTRQTKPKKDMSEAVSTLERMSSRDEGERYLKAMLTDDLRDVAAHLGIGGVSKTRKDDLVALLVEQTIGARLNSAAIRQL